MSSYSIFQESWWWDAVVPGEWEEISLIRGRHTVAGWKVLPRQGPLGLTRLVQPRLTRWAGPWIAGTEAKTSSRLAREKKVVAELIELLPTHDYLMQSLHPQVDYWLPFRWAGFDLEPSVTYRLAPADSQEALWSGFDERIRRAIRKAGKTLRVVEEATPGRLIDSARATYDRQSRALPLPPARIERVVEAAVSRRAGCVLSAVDEADQAHASIFLAWDEARMYYVLGGGDPALRMSGAASLLLMQALMMAATRRLEFDFAGSVVESIERFFRAFGARPVSYVRVSRATSRRFRAYRWLRRGMKPPPE